MSKKNRQNNPWSKLNASPASVMASSEDAITPPQPEPPSPLSSAQMTANRANALLSTGPRTPAGLARSSQNAIKSALTGRTVLLPTDDVEEYARFLAELQQQLKPEGALETELVQIVVDCHWRLRRIQELEYAIYVYGERQFAEQFADEPVETYRSMIMLQTHLTYQKELRNLHIQEARLDRKRDKALAELYELQAERKPADESSMEDLPDKEYFAALDAGYIPPSLAKRMAEREAADQDAVLNGFVCSNPQATLAAGCSGSISRT